LVIDKINLIFGNLHKKEPVDTNNRLFGYYINVYSQHTSLLGKQCVPPPEGEIDVCAYVHFLLFFDGAKINDFFELKNFLVKIAIFTASKMMNNMMICIGHIQKTVSV
jgi:hypothetical protein